MVNDHESELKPKLARDFILARPDSILARPDSILARPDSILARLDAVFSVILSVIISMVLGGLFASCTPEPQSLKITPHRHEPTLKPTSRSLTLWHALRGQDRVHLMSDLARFERQTHIKVNALSLPHDAFANKLQVAIPQGNGPDLMITAHDRIGDWAEAGLLEPVSYWIKSNELNAYLTPALQALTYRHQLYGLPLSCKALALFYNPQLTPDPPQTLTELIEIARALKARHADETARGEDAPRVWGLAVPEIDSLYFHAPWLHAYGGRATRLGRPELDSVAMRRSVHVVHDLRAQGLIPPEIDGALSSTLFKNGELAFLINGPWLVAELGDLPPERWSVAPLPRIKDAEAPLTPYLSVEGVMISSRARDPQLAWRLARYLASTERALARLKRGELVAHSQLDATGALKLPAWQSAFQEQLAMTIPMSNDPLMKALWRPMKLALELTLIRGDDPAMTLKSAQSSALKILEDL